MMFVTVLLVTFALQDEIAKLDQRLNSQSLRTKSRKALKHEAAMSMKIEAALPVLRLPPGSTRDMIVKAYKTWAAVYSNDTEGTVWPTRFRHWYSSTAFPA